MTKDFLLKMLLLLPLKPWTNEIAKNNDHINVKPLKGQFLKFKTLQDFNNSISWGKDMKNKEKG